MKTDRVISKIEEENKGLRKCRYCGGEAKVYIRQDRNFKGDKGYVATVRCDSNCASVFAFGKDEKSADIMARNYWNRGVLDAQ